MNYLENPLVQPSPLEKCFLRDLTEVAKDCYYRAWAPATSGNFSIHLRKGLVWQSLSGSCKGRLTARSFVPISLADGRKLGFALGVPSEEMLVHLKIYQLKSEARCVVHAHPSHLIKHSKGKSELKFQGYEIQKALSAASLSDTLSFKLAPIQDKSELEGFCEDHLEGFLHTDAQLLMFAGHGIYAWDETPLKALERIEAMESLCTVRK